MKCYHCNLEIYKEYSIEINKKIYKMCCPGCLAVFQFIINSNLNDYYKNREYPGNKIDFLHIDQNDELKENKYYKANEYSKKNITLSIEGISCAACIWLIEKHFSKINSIINFKISLITSKVNLTWYSNLIKLKSILNEFKKIGYKAYPYKIKLQEEINKKEYNEGLKNLIISGLGMMQVMMLSFALYIGEFYDIAFNYWSFIRWVSFIITTPILFIPGRKIIDNAFRNLKNKNLGMDFTISVSLILAYIASIKNLIYAEGDIYFDSICMFIFFLLTARFLEMRTRHHSMEIIISLENLNNNVARKLTKKNIEKYISLKKIKKNNKIIVKPGEIIPLDGIIKNGFTTIDESMLTGEFKPINKKKNDYVIGGTTNINNKIIIKVTNNYKKSKLNKIIKILEKTTATKILNNNIINKISKYFVTIVILLTIIITLIWIYIGHQNVINVTLSMLVITCPCALSLAIPTALVTSVNALAKNGIIINKENIFEEINKSTDIIFDKTGTLTINKYYIQKIKLFRNVSIKKILSLATYIENNSSHPISRAFIKKNIYIYNILENEKTKNIISKGIIGYFNKTKYAIGNLNLKNIINKKKCYIFKKNFNIFLKDKYGIIASFKLINPIRKNLKKCIKDLKMLKKNIHILTGDPSNKVFMLKKNLQIDYIKNNYTINKKRKYIKKLQKNKKKTIMIGDGINDTLALNTSNVSISMGSGSDLAKINSDIILLNNNLLNIKKIIIHSKKTYKIINQNILWAIIYNITGLLIASLDLITPYYSAIGMSLSSLFVVLNSLRAGNIK